MAKKAPEEPVWLGIIEEGDEIRDELADEEPWKVNKIGGFPLFSPNFDQESIISIQSLTCICGSIVKFVAQMFCPVDDIPFDRVNYIFICVSKQCKDKCWYVLRCISQVVKCNREEKVVDNEWINSQEDWGDGDEDTMHDQNQQLCSRLESVTLDKSSKAIESLSHFYPFYISVIEEPTQTTEDEHVKMLLEHYEKNVNQLNEAGTKSLEPYEKTQFDSIYRGDKITKSFFKILNRCPEQIVRYFWKGKMIVNSAKSQINIENCPNCGSERSFEMQLMPALINFLKPLNDDVVLDFGTVLIFTCAKNCILKPFSKEQVIVLPDPDSDLMSSIKL